MILIPAPELCGDFGAQEGGIAPGYHQRIFPAVMKRAQDPAPGRKMLDLVKEKMPGGACPRSDRKQPEDVPCPPAGNP